MHSQFSPNYATHVFRKLSKDGLFDARRFIA